MKKLLLILLCVPLIGFGQCVSGDCENGYGILIDTNSWDGEVSKYVGEFKDGKQHGECVYYTGNGNIFIGTQIDDSYYNGTYIWSSGEIYIGEFVNNQINGRGMYFSNTNNDRALPVNTKYEGEFSDGLTPNGYGKATYSDGTVKEGLWKDGKFIGE